MAYVYPAQNSCYKKCSKQAERIQAIVDSPSMQLLMKEDIVRQIVLEKNGVQFSGWMISDPARRENGQWALQAAGNGEFTLEYVAHIGKQYMDSNFNTILVDNPGVGDSQGTSTPATMGEVQELALTFLETQKNVNKIAVIGRSLGGAAIGRAVLQHDFNPKIQYLVIPQMTFGSLSHIAKKMVKAIAPCLKGLVAPIIRWTDLEMDNVAASNKLAACNIPECIINCRDPMTGEYALDGVIPGKATLGARLQKMGISQHLKITSYSTPTNFEHNSRESFDLTADILSRWDRGAVPLNAPV
jgi:hypothetical protein